MMSQRSPEQMGADAAVAEWLEGFDGWRQPATIEAVWDALVQRAHARYCARWGVPPRGKLPDLSASMWELFTDVEKRIAWALEAYDA